MSTTQRDFKPVPYTLTALSQTTTFASLIPRLAPLWHIDRAHLGSPEHIILVAAFINLETSFGTWK